jgi:recombination protein RecA
VMFGNPETTTGGNALKFYATVRMDIRKVASLKDGENIVGNRTRVKVVKNKLAAPFREAEFDIMYGRGIDHTGDVLDLASNLGVVLKSGTWYSYNEERLGQGKDRVVELLNDNPSTLASIEHGVRALLGFATAEPAEAAPVAEPAADGRPARAKKSAS